MSRTTRNRAGTLLSVLAVIGAWALLATSPASAANTPLTPRPMFAWSDDVDPLVTVHALDSFTAPNNTNINGRVDEIGVPWTLHEGSIMIQGNAATSPNTGIATVPTTVKDVMVKADLLFGSDDRYTGVVLHRGPVGELRVIVERDKKEQNVVLAVVVSGVITILQTTPQTRGLPKTAALRVESIEGLLRVWLDGTLVMQRTLTGIEAVIANQTRYGLLVDPDAKTSPGQDKPKNRPPGFYDRVAGFMVIAPH